MVTHQLQVERRTGKVRRPETDVLPLCHATNLASTRNTCACIEFGSWFQKAVIPKQRWASVCACCVTANVSSEQSSPATSFSESSPKPPRRCMSSQTSHASDHPSSAAASNLTAGQSYCVHHASATQRANHEHSRSSDRSSVKSGMSGEFLPTTTLSQQTTYELASKYTTISST